MRRDPVNLSSKVARVTEGAAAIGRMGTELLERVAKTAKDLGKTTADRIGRTADDITRAAGNVAGDAKALLGNAGTAIDEIIENLNVNLRPAFADGDVPGEYYFDRIDPGSPHGGNVNIDRAVRQETAEKVVDTGKNVAGDAGKLTGNDVQFSKKVSKRC
jgi:hypothetical protein